ncbi:nucleotide-binding protein [Pseudomonas sp. CFBP 13602]|uniref:nucleotide-binding protein n=1 Tax=Pseudomonas sp. CFBP 13602 TaxID=2774039 RepID=UPI001782B83E|nr:conjugal transfer protein TraL [Pseudomonas sp. CFBP 13602]MBD8829001.1 conjugal transfer protein TraL [Pseudomonas sp. CFBP 13602]
MATIHVMLQGKGGVGKSFGCSALAQFYEFKERKVTCIDTDPVNATFAGYSALNVQRLEIMNDQKQINPRNFDNLIELIATTDCDIIIDNGSSSFVPLTHYLISNQVPALIKEMGHDLVIHTVVTGGQALVDTVSGLGQLASQFPQEASFVVWLNPFWGAIEHEGKPFEQMKAYKDNKARISSIVHVPNLDPDTFGKDLSQTLQDRITFDQALANPDLTVMNRQRLKLIRTRLFDQLETAGVI